jgi:serine/threonine protein phosphatase PrpC
MASEGLCVHVAAMTHPGKVRGHNEDCVVVDGWLSQGAMEQPETFVQTLEEPLLCLVADGMGGHAAGEIASRYVAKQLSKEVSQLSTDKARLAEGLLRIHKAFYTEMQRAPERIGMGTTVAGLILSQEEVLIFNVGDSRVYQRQDQFLIQLSTDDVPRATFEGMRNQPRVSHAITQSLGGFVKLVDITPHIVSHSLKAGREYLLCTDGVTDMLADDVMEACVADDPALSVTGLFKKAMAAGGRDNITVIAVRIQPQV